MPQMFKTYCVVDRKPIPEKRHTRRSNTCGPECAKKLRAERRREIDQRRCHACSRPSTPEQRAAFKLFANAQKHAQKQIAAAGGE